VKIPKTWAAVVVLFVLPAHLAAQATAASLAIGGIDKLLDRIESISIFRGSRLGTAVTDTITAGGQAPWRHDYGLEFGVHLGDFADRMTYLPWTRDAEYDVREGRRLIALARADEDRRTCKCPARPDSIHVKLADGSYRLIEKPKGWDGEYTLTKLTVKRRTGMADDSIAELAPKPPKPPLSLIELDLGIGYGQLDGIVAHVPYEVHGNVRELPALSLYVSMHLGNHVDVYAGARTGAMSLQDTQLYLKRTALDSNKVPRAAGDSAITINASSFEFGIPVGVELGIGDARLFLEYGHTLRVFNSLNYSTPLPEGAPHSLDFSGHGLLFGVQIPIPKPKKE
jgi:hypothetical protein